MLAFGTFLSGQRGAVLDLGLPVRAVETALVVALVHELARRAFLSGKRSAVLYFRVPICAVETALLVPLVHELAWRTLLRGQLGAVPCCAWRGAAGTHACARPSLGERVVVCAWWTAELVVCPPIEVDGTVRGIDGLAVIDLGVVFLA